MSGDNPSVDEDGFQTMTVSSRRNKPKTASDNHKKKTNLQRQRRSANNHTGKRQPNRGRNAKKGFSSGGPSLSSRGWSKPSEGWDVGAPELHPEAATLPEEPMGPGHPDDPVDGASETMASVVRDELSKATTADEKINAALASTAAATTIASLMNSMGFQTTRPEASAAAAAPAAATTSSAPLNFASFAKGQNMQDLLGDLGEKDPHWKEKQFPAEVDDDDRDATPEPPANFSAFCKGQSTSDLLAEFGQADPHWKQKVVEEPVEEPAAKRPTATTKSSKQQQQQHSKLAPHGKAAIHLSIESFGVAHGAPSRGARDRSGSPHTQPLEWLDVGDSVTDPVPEHLEFHDGLRSGVIKRLLKTAELAMGPHHRGWDDDDADDSSVDLDTVRDFSGYCRDHLAATKIFPSLLEAIHEGGHGYVSPLTMRFSVGSRLGRHRSVVATEWIAQHLRHLLRVHNQNVMGSTPSSSNTTTQQSYSPRDRRPITCSVSVGTVHRDVNKRIPQKHYKEDDEDYVDKKDRV